MSRACKKFEPNTWSKDLCANCLRSKQLHTIPTSPEGSNYEAVNVFSQIPSIDDDIQNDSSSHSSLELSSSHPDVVQSCHDYENELVLESLNNSKSECSLLDEVLGAVRSSDTTSHYYHTYDDSHKKVKETVQMPSLAGAVPYDVVDVKSTDDTIRKPRVPKANAFQTRGAVSKKTVFHGDIIRAASPAVMRSRKMDSANNGGCDAYEEIDVKDEPQQDSESPSRAPQGKSSYIQAKVNVLGDIDVQKSLDDGRATDSSPKRKEADATKSKQKRGFFSRWLKKGSTTESQDSCQSSVELDSKTSFDHSPKTVVRADIILTDVKNVAVRRQEALTESFNDSYTEDTEDESGTLTRNRSKNSSIDDRFLTDRNESFFEQNNDDNSTLKRETTRQSKRKSMKPDSAPPPPPTQKDIKPPSSPKPQPQAAIRQSLINKQTPPSKRSAKTSPTKHVTLNIHSDVIRSSIDSRGKNYFRLLFYHCIFQPFLNKNVYLSVSFRSAEFLTFATILYSGHVCFRISTLQKLRSVFLTFLKSFT